MPFIKASRLGNALLFSNLRSSSLDFKLLRAILKSVVFSKVFFLIVGDLIIVLSIRSFIESVRLTLELNFNPIVKLNISYANSLRIKL